MALRPDHLEAERFSALGPAPAVVLDATADAQSYAGTQAILIGVDREGLLPAVDENLFDVLLTSAANAPRPWVSVSAPDVAITALTEAVRATPHAASVLRQVLRLTENLQLEQGLLVESLAYSALLGGAEFARWRQTNPAAPLNNIGRVEYARDGDHVTLTLASPETRNAMTAAMRDALFEALAAVLDDPSAPTVTIRAEGACFSTGGDLNEFGANTDLAAAHTIRTTRSIARLIDELGDRAEVVFHGACIGSGLEGFAAARKRVALDGAYFQLPEVRMGLIPGAGGTATVARAIGRHRACFMMLGGARLRAKSALEWGLVHAIPPAP